MATSSKYSYKPHQEYIVVNDNDPDLEPIRIELPAPPALTKVIGYGRKPENQYWEPDEVPERLVELMRDPDLQTNDDIWEVLENNYEEYKKEWKFIQQQWEYRINGCWFFNNGEPTYITGAHWFFLSTWKMDGALPEYRSRDRKWWLSVKFGEEDPVCMGITYPKHRREGATSRTQCWMYERISRNAFHYGGIQSMTEPHAETVFQNHMVNGWKGMPFWFQPVHEGTTNPKRELSFKAPARAGGKKSIRSVGDDALNSTISFGASTIGHYDTWKLHAYHADEVGKTKEVDVNKRWQIVKQCLRVGRKVIGFSIHTSTVGEMEKGGGKNFKKLCDQSHYSHHDPRLQRNKNGETISGLYVIFIPAYDGLEDFVDKYGNSVIDKPTKEQAAFIGSDIGAREYLDNKRKALIEAEDMEGLSEQIRMYPTRYRECFYGSSKSNNFNVVILNEQIAKYAVSNPHVQPGNFEWTDGQDSRVTWNPCSDGRFNLSLVLNDQQSNRFKRDDLGKAVPANKSVFQGGGDPFKFKETQSGRKSMAGGAVFMKSSPTFLHPRQQELGSNRFVCTYLARPKKKEIFGEDMIKMCVYFGCTMFPEINVSFLWDYFDSRGYNNYLYYRVDKKTKRVSKTPGANTLEQMKESIFNHFHTYIEENGYREVHTDLLQQCLDIDDDMGDYDLFTASGYALVAAMDPFARIYDEEETDEGAEIGSFFRRSNY